MSHNRSWMTKSGQSPWGWEGNMLENFGKRWDEEQIKQTWSSQQENQINFLKEMWPVWTIGFF